MTENFDIISKMDPMARKCLAAVEAITKAIETNNRDSIESHIMMAENALSMLKSDLNTHYLLAKAMKPSAPADRFMGVIPQYDNTASDYNGTENAVALGVSRHGRDSGYFQPHRVV